MFATSYSKLQMECMTHEEENELTAVSGGSGVVKRLFIAFYLKNNAGGIMTLTYRLEK